MVLVTLGPNVERRTPSAYHGGIRAHRSRLSADRVHRRSDRHPRLRPGDRGHGLSPLPRLRPCPRRGYHQPARLGRRLQAGRSLPRDLHPLRLPGRADREDRIRLRRHHPAPATDRAGGQAGGRDRCPQQWPSAPGGRGWMERRRVRGPGQELCRPRRPVRRADRAAARAMDKRGRHLRGQMGAGHRGRSQPDARPATHPDLDWRLRRSHAQTDRAHRRGLVPMARPRREHALRDGPPARLRHRGRPRSRPPSGSSPSSTSAAAPRTNGAPTSPTGKPSAPPTSASAPWATASPLPSSTSMRWPARPRNWASGNALAGNVVARQP